MKINDFIKSIDPDKIEITKQEEIEIQKIFDYKIVPHENHTLFEFDLKTKTIKKAEFKPPNTTVHWFEALQMYHKQKFKKVDIYNPQTISKSEVIKKENCIYISALNVENAIKIIKRDHNISL